MKSKPTKAIEFACVLDYDAETMAAPEVSAVGCARLAKAIREEALPLGVPIVENAPLTEELAAIQPGEQIPEKLYADIAEILASIESE